MSESDECDSDKFHASINLMKAVSGALCGALRDVLMFYFDAKR